MVSDYEEKPIAFLYREWSRRIVPLMNEHQVVFRLPFYIDGESYVVTLNDALEGKWRL